MDERVVEERLEKELNLYDVFAICTGAMFSSGFFLLPGLASAEAGPAVILSYLLAGFLVLPAMLSKAELCTAMPRAGGTYFFMDRSMGPLVGTIGGLGTWISLILKSAFGLIGMGAYLALFMDVPVTALAIVLTVLFTVVNVVGAKESGRLQRVLVAALLVVLGFFIVQGSVEVFSLGLGEVGRNQFHPFAPFGAEGVISTVGLVFVSFAGLTKVASIAEEVKDADRNIPLGMFLSLVAATTVYVVGVAIMVAVLDPESLRSDLTPVATAAEAFFDWLPGSTGLILVTVAAVAAFASTGNAGIMSASRYVLAMGRDRVLSPELAELGRFKTPTRALLLTAGVMILCLLLLDVKSVAKLASSFKLLIFAMVNAAVIVMRESRIEGYDPGFRSPLYPWIQVVGVLVPLWLVTLMGWEAVLFTLMVVVLSAIWYRFYVRGEMVREGAIYHLFERLGRQRDPGLDRELREVLKERNVREEDPFAHLVAEADFIDLGDEEVEYETIVWQVAAGLAERLPFEAEPLARGFLEESRLGLTPVSKGVALPHLRMARVRSPYLVLVRAAGGAKLPVEDRMLHEEGLAEPIRAFFFMISSETQTAEHLRILTTLARRAEDESFLEQWLVAENERELKEAVLHDDRFLSLRVRAEGPTAELAGREVREVTLGERTLIALIHRDSEVVIPRGRTRIEEGDRLTIVGSPDELRTLRKRFRSP